MDIKHPVLFFDKSMVGICTKKNPINIVTKRGIRSGGLKKVVVVDSNQMKIIIKEVKIIGFANRFFGLNIFLNQKFIADIIPICDPVPISLDEIKNLLIGSLEKNPSFWASAGDLNDMKSEVRNLKNFGDIFKLEFLN